MKRAHLSLFILKGSGERKQQSYSHFPNANDIGEASWFHWEMSSIKPTEEICVTTLRHDSAFPTLLGYLI